MRRLLWITYRAYLLVTPLALGEKMKTPPKQGCTFFYPTSHAHREYSTYMLLHVLSLMG